MIRRYKKGDALNVLVQEAQKEEFNEAVQAFDEVGAYSLVGDDGEVLAVFGYALDEGNVADCYALISFNAGRYLLQAIRFLKAEIFKQAMRLKLSKLRMTVRTGFAAGVRFARLLGFDFTHNLPRFYNEIDYQLFERMERK